MCHMLQGREGEKIKSTPTFKSLLDSLCLATKPSPSRCDSQGNCWMLLYIAGIVKTAFSLEAFCNSSVLVLLSGTERQKASPAGDDSMAGAGTPNMFYIQPLCSLPIYLLDTHFSFQWAMEPSL